MAKVYAKFTRPIDPFATVDWTLTGAGALPSAVWNKERVEGPSEGINQCGRENEQLLTFSLERLNKLPTHSLHMQHCSAHYYYYPLPEQFKKEPAAARAKDRSSAPIHSMLMNHFDRSLYTFYI